MREEFRVHGGIAGGEEHFGGGPGEFVVVHEGVAVVGDFLIGAVAAVLGDGALEEGPAFGGAIEIVRGGGGEFAFEAGRRGGLRESGDGGGAGGGVFGEDDLRVAFVREDVVFVSALA